MALQMDRRVDTPGQARRERYWQDFPNCPPICPPCNSRMAGGGASDVIRLPCLGQATMCRGIDPPTASPPEIERHHPSNVVRAMPPGSPETQLAVCRAVQSGAPSRGSGCVHTVSGIRVPSSMSNRATPSAKAGVLGQESLGDILNVSTAANHMGTTSEMVSRGMIKAGAFCNARIVFQNAADGGHCARNG